MQATIHDIERLFGTSDLNALEQIAKQWAAADANPRGAGRKKKFALDEVVAMKAMQQDGATEAQLAKQYRETLAELGRAERGQPPDEIDEIAARRAGAAVRVGPGTRRRAPGPLEP